MSVNVSECDVDPLDSIPGTSLVLGIVLSGYLFFIGMHNTARILNFVPAFISRSTREEADLAFRLFDHIIVHETRLHKCLLEVF